MNILNSTDPIEISHELRIQHEKLDNDQSKIPSIGTMKVIAETALRFFEISNDNLKNPDQKKHLEFLI